MLATGGGGGMRLPGGWRSGGGPALPGGPPTWGSAGGAPPRGGGGGGAPPPGPPGGGGPAGGAPRGWCRGPAVGALPCEATLRRCLQVTDSAALDAAVAGWAVGRLAVRQALAAGANVELVPADRSRRVIALDGKTLRGSPPPATAEQVAV